MQSCSYEPAHPPIHPSSHLSIRLPICLQAHTCTHARTTHVHARTHVPTHARTHALTAHTHARTYKPTNTRAHTRTHEHARTRDRAVAQVLYSCACMHVCGRVLLAIVLVRAFMEGHCGSKPISAKPGMTRGGDGTNKQAKPCGRHAISVVVVGPHRTLCAVTRKTETIESFLLSVRNHVRP